MLPLEEYVADIHRQLHREDGRVEPPVLVPHADYQPGVLLVDGVQVIEKRSYVARTLIVTHSQEHPPWLLEIPAIHRGERTHGKLRTYFQVLVLGHDLPGACLPPVINQIVSVPAGPAPTALSQPG